MADQPVNITDARARQKQDHATKVRKLFVDYPELAETAIIDPESGIALAPEHMNVDQLIATFERAKLSIALRWLNRGAGR